ncbi:MAG TPA: hypothetical protein QF873_02330 [Patescibacteria group bacterium]|nr:hypothetical protein [Patescibacteria group bacterium]
MAFELILGRVLALFMVITGLAILANRKEFVIMAKQIKSNHIVLWIGGAIDFIVGLFIVVGHNVWTNDWRVLITVFGWLALMEGTLLWFLPNKSIKLVQIWKRPAYTYTAGLLMLAVGVYMTIVTFF